TALFLAAEQGHESLVRLFLKNGADIEAKNSNDQTILQVAAKGGQEDIVRFLVNEAEINAKGGHIMGDALDAAVRSRNVPIVRFLFEKGAN
ncbi:ankyrin repeat protein, partial [Pyronema domesticum]